jgi:16S rRNA (cytidine1402-2'-O)-methyltransferase
VHGRGIITPTANPRTHNVVATPTGNLEDVTFRALRVLREVSIIAAEDTRRTSRLLQQYSISTPTTSLHEHNERSSSARLLARLAAGESVALVSDAGTPTVSDPGARLVSAAHDAGIRVEPVPGPSAVAAAVSASGFGGDSFLFLGFPPSRSSARKTWFEHIATVPYVLVFYEAPHRIRACLIDALDVLGDRPIVLCRELTKVHEYVVKSPISAALESDLPERGEFTVVVSPAQAAQPPVGSLPSERELATEFGLLTNDNRVGRREALRLLAKKYGLSTKAVYDGVERGRKYGE